MKYAVFTAAVVLSTFGAFAQGIAPLTGSVLFVTEVARDVSFGWSDKKAWSGYVPTEMKWSRAVDGLEIFAGKTANILIDTKTYFQYGAAAGESQLSETFSQSSTREGQSLEPGATWKADRTYAGQPATWCHDTKSNYDSKFEVDPREAYTLLIDGKETTLEVTPVVERGWWNRCYSGKRFTRLLVSREIGAVLSIEHVGYTPQGQAHSSSYRMNVKEIKRQ